MSGAEETIYSRKGVLVIDDQPFVRKTVTLILRQMGFVHILEAEDGESGLETCMREIPDLIVCDIEMKPVDGLKFLQELRGDAKTADRNIPVVFLTNHAESEIVRQAIDLGVNAFIIKPPSLSALKSKIDKLFGIAPPE